MDQGPGPGPSEPKVRQLALIKGLCEAVGLSVRGAFWGNGPSQILSEVCRDALPSGGGDQEIVSYTLHSAIRRIFACHLHHSLPLLETM
jgi:hypothetical protein